MDKTFYFSPKSLKIDLDNGIYSMGQEGATGKTYLLSLINKLGGIYNSVKTFTMTYSDDMDIESIIKKLSGNNYDIILLDRFDLYANSDICKILDKMQDDSIILLDTKYLGGIKEFSPAFCSIILSETLVEVTL